jgi:hypothetical protein
MYEREKQGTQGKQEGAADEPQREEKAEEGEEEQVGWIGRILLVFNIKMILELMITKGNK